MNDSCIFALSLLINSFFCLGFGTRGSGPREAELLLLFQSRSSLWCSSLLIDSDRAKANPLLHNPPYGFTIGHTHIHTKRLERPHTPLHVPAACGTLNSDRGQDIGGRAGPRAGRLCRKPCSCWKVFHIKEYGAEGGIDQPCWRSHTLLIPSLTTAGERPQMVPRQRGSTPNIHSSNRALRWRTSRHAF